MGDAESIRAAPCSDFVYYGGTGATFIADGTGMPHDDLADVLADYLAMAPCHAPATSGRITAMP